MAKKMSSASTQRHEVKAKNRKQVKARNRKQDDIPGVESITETNFYVDPKLETGKLSEVNPYDSIIGSERSEIGADVWKKESQKSNRMLPYSEEEHQAASDIDIAKDSLLQMNDNFPKRKSKTAEWDMYKKWSDYSTNSTLSPKRRIRAKANRNRLCPSPLAQNVGNIMQNLGYVVVDFFIHLCKLTSGAGTYQGPIGVLLIIACLYYSLMYVEISLANAAEIGLDWLWPCVHTILRSIERLLRSSTNLVQSIDELGESMVCDWAHLWCSQFNLMCHQRCSFTSKTLERFRYSNQA